MTAERSRRLLAVVVALHCVLAATYSGLVPLFEAPDEVWHFSFARILATERAIPVQSTAKKDVWLRESGQPPLYYMVAAPLVAALDTSDFPAFVRFNSAHPAVTPGVEARVNNVFIHTPRERFPYRGAVLAVHAVRLLGMLWGAATVIGVYLVARQVAPERRELAVAAAAFTAFNPHFVFVSAVVNNDVAAALMCTLVLWLALRIRRDSRPVTRGSVALGIALGLALLSKMSALALLPLVAVALALPWRRDRDGRALATRFAVVFGLAALTATWWYGRNWALYGDPLAWGVWTMDLPPSTVGPTELVRQLGHVATSYWSPYDQLYHPAVYAAVAILVTCAGLGWLALAVRKNRRWGIDVEGLLLAVFWLALLVASLLEYMTTTPSDEGRLLFPGVAAVALFLAIGIAALVPPLWSGRALVLSSVALLSLCAAVPFLAIAPRFEPPLLDGLDDVAATALFDAGALGDVALLGALVEPQVVQPGGEVEVTLHWQALAVPSGELRAVVQLWSVGGRLLGQHDTAPAGAEYPPDLWQAGDIVRDRHWIDILGDGPAVGYLSVRVMDGERVVGEASTSPVLRVQGGPVEVEAMVSRGARFSDHGIQLMGYAVSGRPRQAGEELALTLYWRAAAKIPDDYSVFVHLVDASGAILAQGDGPPVGGDMPTSHWPVGEVIADTHMVPLAAPVPEGATLLVGLYGRGMSGHAPRLPAYDSNGVRYENDAVALDAVVEGGVRSGSQ